MDHNERDAWLSVKQIVVHVLSVSQLSKLAACRSVLQALHVNDVSPCAFAWDAMQPHVHAVHPDAYLQSVALAVHD